MPAVRDSGTVKDVAMKIKFVAALFLFALVGSVHAATLGCPDLVQATQVGACPSEEELQYTFTGYCSDDNKVYRGETDVCTDYRLYRKLKNVALWEAGDGSFDGYVSCELPVATVRTAKPQSLKMFKQGKLSRLVCGYGENLQFTHRTRVQCQVEAADCGANGMGCKATCE